VASDEERIEAPLLRDYLARMPRYARYMPHVPGWIPWVVFFGVNVLLKPTALGRYDFFIALAVACSVPYLVRLPFRPRSEEERSEQKFLDSIRLIRRYAKEGTIRKKLPPPVLAALERCASARVAGLSQLACSDPVEQAVESEAIEGCMRAAIVSVLHVVRPEEQGRREWEALCSNRAVIGAMVDAIQTLEDRMSRPSIVLTERLAALRELEETQLVSDTHREAAPPTGVPNSI
jgi:hypothetical protein